MKITLHPKQIYNRSYYIVMYKKTVLVNDQVTRLCKSGGKPANIQEMSKEICDELNVNFHGSQLSQKSSQCWEEVILDEILTTSDIAEDKIMILAPLNEAVGQENTSPRILKGGTQVHSIPLSLVLYEQTGSFKVNYLTIGRLRMSYEYTTKDTERKYLGTDHFD